jgi:hypothetical protein
MKGSEAQNDVNFYFILFFPFILDFLYIFNWAYLQLGYQKGWFNRKDCKDYFGCLLHLLFHDYNGLVYDYN